MPEATAPAPLAIDPSESRSRAIRQIASAFALAGIDEPLREARLVLLAALGLTAADLIANGDRSLGENAKILELFAKRRLCREPLARLTGRREFYGLSFDLGPATLIPRPDTETLVDAVLDHARARGLDKRPITVVDLGTGTGAILAALLIHLPLARGLGIDLSPEAVGMAAQNVERACGVGRAELRAGNWLEGVAGEFEIIVSNPPYIPAGDIADLEREVAHHDPVLALDGGADGLDAYRALAEACPARLARGGLIGLELGIGQAEAVEGLFGKRGFARCELRPDLGGIPRALVLARPVE